MNLNLLPNQNSLRFRTSSTVIRNRLLLLVWLQIKTHDPGSFRRDRMNWTTSRHPPFAKVPDADRMSGWTIRFSVSSYSFQDMQQLHGPSSNTMEHMGPG